MCAEVHWPAILILSCSHKYLVNSSRYQYSVLTPVVCAELIRLAHTGYEPWVLTRQNPNQRDLDPERSLRTVEINNLSMGKYDHICELTGAENYAQWRRQMMLALKGEHLWNHCSNGSDPLDLTDFAIDKPTPVDPAAVTDTEKEKILDWLAKDAQAKALVDRKISTVVANQLNENQTACEQWDILSEHYLWNDILSQYKLRARVRSEKLKDTDDTSRYLGIFEDARRRFIQMGITYSNDEAIFDLLQGLPDGVEWQIFKEFTMNRMSTSSSSTATSSTTPSTPLTFDEVAKLFTEKANTIVGRRKLAGPGSEYANIAIVQGTRSNIRINPVTGLRMHCNNPKGVKCTNTLCADLPRADNHDHTHCYWPGGGMESKAPAWIRNKTQKSEMAAVAMATPPAPSLSAPPNTSNNEYQRELSCAAITEPPDSVVNHSHSASFISTLLNSGTTLHLVTGREYFLDFRMEDNPGVQTVNHGMLCTTGRGTCIAELILGSEKYRVTLHKCLHAPEALVNLLSVGHMLEKGWDCEFRGSCGGGTAHCQLSYNGEVLGSLPLVGNLCHVNLQFIHPNELVSRTLRVKEISVVARPGTTLDLWHAWMGHPGSDLVKCLPLVATGVHIDHSAPLSRCKACIMAKHPRKPYPPSSSPCAEHMLDLIHSDLCGPFPVCTPHAKLYFIVFLDDHTHLLNVQLLASKDQALGAWRIVKSLWENHSERKVNVFRSDNGREFLSTEFTRALEEVGIEQQLAAPYAHQQNGKAERAM